MCQVRRFKANLINKPKPVNAAKTLQHEQQKQRLQTTGTAKMHAKSECNKFAFEIHTDAERERARRRGREGERERHTYTDCQHRLKNKATVWRLFQLCM